MSKNHQKIINRVELGLTPDLISRSGMARLCPSNKRESSALYWLSPDLSVKILKRCALITAPMYN